MGEKYHMDGFGKVKTHEGFLARDGLNNSQAILHELNNLQSEVERFRGVLEGVVKANAWYEQQRLEEARGMEDKEQHEKARYEFAESIRLAKKVLESE